MERRIEDGTVSMVPNDHSSWHAPEHRHGSASWSDATGHKNMQQLIQLRWIALVGQVATISIASFGLGVPLPLNHMLAALALLGAFNLASLVRWRAHRVVSNAELFVAMLVDTGIFTAQLHLSGGVTNPFVFLYLLQVILAAVLLETRWAWTVVVVTALCMVGLTLFSRPLPVPFDIDQGMKSLYIDGLLICFGLIAALLVTFITRIGRNLRARDMRLADMRQRAAEEEHIVRMGLLASGAAHELGTPLATLAVILGDWKHLPHFSSDPELLDEVIEMESQIQRCKQIVSGILLAAGDPRGDSPAETTIGTFMDELAAEWESTRPVRRFSYENRFGNDLPMVSDSALKQMICNVLDNAVEASPAWVRLDVARDHESLILTVSDRGPGFTDDMLETFGKPYRSTKGRPGGGLGLFLVVNVARTLGGVVTASNRDGGGAIVALRLPLTAITIDDEASMNPVVNATEAPAMAHD